MSSLKANMRLSEGRVGITYMIKRIEGTPDRKAMLMTYGLVPGSLVKITRTKSSGRALLVENLSSSRLIAISRELAEKLIVEEFNGYVSD